MKTLLLCLLFALPASALCVVSEEILICNDVNRNAETCVIGLVENEDQNLIILSAEQIVGENENGFVRGERVSLMRSPDEQTFEGAVVGQNAVVCIREGFIVYEQALNDNYEHPRFSDGDSIARALTDPSACEEFLETRNYCGGQSRTEGGCSQTPVRPLFALFILLSMLSINRRAGPRVLRSVTSRTPNDQKLTNELSGRS